MEKLTGDGNNECAGILVVESIKKLVGNNSHSRREYLTWCMTLIFCDWCWYVCCRGFLPGYYGCCFTWLCLYFKAFWTISYLWWCYILTVISCECAVCMTMMIVQITNRYGLHETMISWFPPIICDLSPQGSHKVSFDKCLILETVLSWKGQLLD